VSRFRKLPVVIEAVQWTGANCAEVFAFMGLDHEPHDEEVDEVTISTSEGVMTASIDDWIIRGVKGRSQKEIGGAALVIPPGRVQHWERQIATPYDQLTEREKASDREQVDRYLPMVVAAVRTQVAEEIRAAKVGMLGLPTAPLFAMELVTETAEWAARIAEGGP